MSVGDSEFKTKAQVAYEYLRRLIIGGELPPGSRVLIGEVANALGFSQTPVREAVRELVSKGALVLKPHVGVMVPEYSDHTVRELFEIRAVLEGLATRLNAPYLSEEGFAYLEDVIEKSRACASKGDFLQYAELDKQFHFYIYKAGPYEFLFGMISELWDRNVRFSSVFRICKARMLESANEHSEIVHAMKAGKAALCEELMRKHKQASGRIYMEHMKIGSKAEA
ncbi:MAG: GntR family transcriptional regulator [Bacillota bacterium]